MHTGEQGWGLSSVLPYYAVAFALLGLFIRIQARAPEPLLPFSLFRIRLVTLSCLAGFLLSATLFGITSYLPLYVQGVLDGRARDAGSVLIPMAVVWPLGSMLGGRLILRLGYRAAVALGTTLAFAGALALLVLHPAAPRWYAVPPMAVLGLGMGFSITSFIIAVQNAVGWHQRGLATGTAQFARSIGGTFGVALLGTVLNTHVQQILSGLGPVGHAAPGPRRSAVDLLLDPTTRAGLTPELHRHLQLGLDGGLHAVFALAAGAAGLASAVACLFPSGRVVARAPDTADVEPATARE
jgi:predicted MFS family arabinose efflux permease